VSNDEHARHENTFLHYVWKRNHKWVELESDILALKGLKHMKAQIRLIFFFALS